MKLRAAVVLAAAIAISAALLAQGPRRDGKWETTVEMDMAGMPMKLPPTVSTRCVTKEQANDPQKMFPQGRGGRGGREGNDNCTYSDQKFEGNKMTWSMKCEGAQPMSGSGEMTFGDGTYTGVIKMDIGGRGTMNLKYSGKRLGDCDQ